MINRTSTYYIVGHYSVKIIILSYDCEVEFYSNYTNMNNHIKPFANVYILKF